MSLAARTITQVQTLMLSQIQEVGTIHIQEVLLITLLVKIIHPIHQKLSLPHKINRQRILNWFRISGMLLRKKTLMKVEVIT